MTAEGGIVERAKSIDQAKSKMDVAGVDNLARQEHVQFIENMYLKRSTIVIMNILDISKTITNNLNENVKV